MATQSSKTTRAKPARARRSRRATLTTFNAWLAANHDTLLKKAGANSIRLTGKPTFGGGDLMSDRITISPNVCHGQACIRGTRVPVHQIVRMLANGDTIEGLLEAYPSITREDIAACLDYAASMRVAERSGL